MAGVNSLNGLESALRCMAQNGTKLVVEAYDMDKLENEYVASAAEKVQQIAHAAGLQSTSPVSYTHLQYTISYNPVSRTGITKDNLQKLKLLHPDIYDEYVTVTYSS